jgi:hypothetical protein
MWVEYEGQPGLLEFLLENFEVFDTEYTFVGEPGDQVGFDIACRDIVLSTGHRAWKGFRREGEADFSQNTPTTYYVWTDLVCVNRARFDEFQRALHFL